jgi:hypothetical protein
MAKHLRTGIAAAFLFASISSAATLLLNPRFVGDFTLGFIVFLVLPIVGGALFGILVGRMLDRLAHVGSSEDPARAYRLLWTSLASLSVFLTTLSLLPPFLGLYSDSESIRYGGALILAAGLAALSGWMTHSVVQRPRAWMWPVLSALPLAVVLAGATTWGRGVGPGSRVLMLAFPGLSWNVAEDLIERGEMPNLSNLRSRGSWGDVQSVKPLLPPVVWTSIASGKVSEEHGVMGFSATTRDVQVKRIWDIYAERGWKIGLFGWPVTWPPEAINGFVVPSITDLGTDAYPRELGFIRELAMSEKTNRPRTWGRYWRYAFLGIRYGAKLETLIDAGKTIVLEPLRGGSLEAAQLFSKRLLRARLSCDHLVDLRRKSSPDFVAFNTNIIHVAQAHFWKYYEPDAFQDISPEDIDRYGESVHDAYRIVDGFIGKILSDTEKDDIVVVVSDHGAEAITDAAAKTFTLRLEPLLAEMRLKNVVEATNLGARTYIRMKDGHEGDLNRIRRLFDTARLGEENARAFQTRVDEWDNLVVTLEPIVNERPTDIVLFQGGRCAVSEIVRAVENQESSQMKEMGALVLCGKGILPGRRIEQATLLDLVPTLLVLTEFDLAADMPGNVIESALAVPLSQKLPGFVSSYEPAVELPEAPSGG